MLVHGPMLEQMAWEILTIDSVATMKMKMGSSFHSSGHHQAETADLDEI